MCLTEFCFFCSLIIRISPPEIKEDTNRISPHKSISSPLISRTKSSERDSLPSRDSLPTSVNKLDNVKILIKEDNTQKIVNENTVYSTDDNNFLGWDCYAGIDTLSLDVNGNILPAYCYTGTKKTIGNWLTDDLAELHWPTDPMKCGDMKCVCVHDIRARKIII